VSHQSHITAALEIAEPHLAFGQTDNVFDFAHGPAGLPLYARRLGSLLHNAGLVDQADDAVAWC